MLTRGSTLLLAVLSAKDVAVAKQAQPKKGRTMDVEKPKEFEKGDGVIIVVTRTFATERPLQPRAGRMCGC
jgi:hypothetical protein